MTLRRLTLALAAAGLSTLSANASAAGRYEFQFITSPDPGGPPSEALAINDNDQIFGTWEYQGSGGVSSRVTGIMSPTADIGKNITIPSRLNNDSGDSLDGYNLVYNGTQYDLRTLMPNFGGTVYFNGINNSGTIVGSAPRDVYRQAFVLILHPDWQGGDGAWLDASHWSMGGLGSLGVKPGLSHDVVIAPTGSATILGAQSASVRSLAITGKTGQIVTLDLAGGSTTTSQGTTLNANAVLTGNGRLAGGLTVQSGALVSVAANQSMQLTGGVVKNSGVMRVFGTAAAPAQLAVAGPLTVVSGGRIQAQSATLDFKGGATIAGEMDLSLGNTNVSGKVTASSGGKVIVSGGGTSAIFYDQVEMQTGSELRVSAGNTATFFGNVIQRTGAKFTGTGTKNYEGGLSVGASPGLGHDEGNVGFGDASTYLAEIGGTTACTADCATDDTLKNHSFDKYVVDGHLTFGGTLQLTSWQGFVAQAGQSFDLFDWGSASGQFSSIDTTGFHTAAGTKLDLSKLYSTGAISVVQVPEPDAMAMVATGLGVLGLLAWRRRNRA